ncbi:hypothetical protein ACMGT0_20525 [Pseudomonas sp. RHF3.3-3]|uniref:hypothetical protein n=1 Tax=Pseudomonas sp. RHF3.3-3 TaxID=3396624 RepID=UPI003A8A763B
MKLSLAMYRALIAIDVTDEKALIVADALDDAIDDMHRRKGEASWFKAESDRRETGHATLHQDGAI